MERHDDNALIVYTDGSSLARPRRGGYAFRLVTTDEAGHEVVHNFHPPGRPGGTNNEMELMACIEALKEIAGKRPAVPPSSYSKVVLYTDSTYVYDHVNEAERAVDALAKESARAAYQEMGSTRIVRRKRSSRQTEPGVVRMRGQTEVIRIVHKRNLARQPYHLYKYEVVDPASPDYGAVDDVYARDGDVELPPTHAYEVRFRGEGRGRWIDEILREVRGN